MPRCHRCDDPDARPRRLWNVDTFANLCNPCNDVVQGPDHADIETENLA